MAPPRRVDGDDDDGLAVHLLGLGLVEDVEQIVRELAAKVFRPYARFFLLPEGSFPS